MVNGISGIDALAAYGRADGIGKVGHPGPTSPGPASPGHLEEVGFGTLVSGFVGEVGDALGKAEKASVAQVAGKGDLIDVVTAIGAAETALDTMVAVRDRVVNAYNEIMRMQI